MQALHLGMDIGGTKAHIGLVDASGSIISAIKMPMNPSHSPETSLRHIAKSALSLLAEQGLSLSDLGSIGAGLPGTVDAETGFLYHAPNLRWKNVPCGDILSSALGARLAITQDSRASALAEYLFGTCSGAEVLVSITLGTGIGCGIVIGGRIFNGGLGAAGESGHICAVPGGRTCACGKKGCTEAYASGTGIMRSAAQVPTLATLDSAAVFDLAKKGNAEALKLLADAVAYLGNSLSAIVNILSPNAMIFSGGMCEQRDLFIAPLMTHIRTHAYALSAQRMHLGVSALSSDAPLIGAAMLTV